MQTTVAEIIIWMMYSKCIEEKSSEKTIIIIINIIIAIIIIIIIDRLVDLVVSVSDKWSWGRGFDPRHFHKF